MCHTSAERNPHTEAIVSHTDRREHMHTPTRPHVHTHTHTHTDASSHTHTELDGGSGLIHGSAFLWRRELRLSNQRISCAYTLPTCTLSSISLCPHCTSWPTNALAGGGRRGRVKPRGRKEILVAESRGSKGGGGVPDVLGSFSHAHVGQEYPPHCCLYQIWDSRYVPNVFKSSSDVNK